MPPGTLEPPANAEHSTIDVMTFGPDEWQAHDIASVNDLARLRSTNRVLWVNITGLADANLVQQIGEMFGFHRLALEDTLHTAQRPKTEHYDDHIYVVLRMASRADGHLDSEQVSLFSGRGFVVTFQERPGDCFDPIRRRIRDNLGRVRRQGADYLAYALIDSVIDAYFPVLEQIGDQVEKLEDDLLISPHATQAATIHDVKRDLLSLRRAVWPLREVLNSLSRDESTHFSPQTHYYLRDAYDHTVQLVDLIETYREIASGLMDVYLSSLSYRMNDVMRVLTIIATIFIPLTFIAGIYGMNFDPDASPWNMPELRWYFGYPLSLMLMALMSGGMLVYFYRKGWMGGASKENSS